MLEEKQSPEEMELDPQDMPEEEPEFDDLHLYTEIEDEEESTEPVQEAVVEREVPDQDEIDEKITRRLARERRKLARLFGTEDMEQAADYAKAGKAVSEAAGLRPGEVVGRLNTTGANQAQQGQPTTESAVSQEIAEIRKLMETEKATKVRETQESEAKKEFGSLFDEHIEAIEDKAEDLGLSLVDAATLVLRPKLGELYAQRTQAQQQAKRKRAVDSSGEAPASTGLDWRSQMSPEMLRTAKKMGMSPKDYHQHAVETGLIKKE